MAIAPALLLALFAFAAGTLPGGARFLPAAAGAAALLAATLFGAREFLDPLRLGRAGRVLLWASGVAVLASLAASPVPRAGFEIALLLPALAVLPAAVARCLGTQARRRTAITAVAALVAAVAIDGLVEKVAQGSDRAAMPLGHHVPFAAFLVLTAPVAALALRGPALSRFLGGLALVATVAALVVARSWLAGTAAAIEMLLAARLLPRVRQLAWGLAFLGAALLVPRAERLLRGGDPSFAARAVYVRAALAGAAARPVLGWGPGSTAWTLPLHERPRPGVNPPGEAVGDAHSLPAQMLFELGGTGTLLFVAVAGLFGARRRARSAGAADPALAAASRLALGGGAIAALGSAFAATAAVPVAAAVVAGLALGAEGEEAGVPAPPSRAPRFAAWIYVALAAVALAPLFAAERRYERAIAAGDDRAAIRRELDRALALDPLHPLYRARWAWASDAPLPARVAAAFAAAREAVGVAPLWFKAGFLAIESGDREASTGAFARALALDPLGAMAPYHLFLTDPARRTDCGARAVASEPRLLAATLFRGREELRAAVVARVVGIAGLDAGWREALRREAATPIEAGGPEVDLEDSIDTNGALAPSYYLFRREPWPAGLARVRLDAAAARRITVPSAAVLALSKPEAFPADRCLPAAGAD